MFIPFNDFFPFKRRKIGCWVSDLLFSCWWGKKDLLVLSGRKAIHTSNFMIITTCLVKFLLALTERTLFFRSRRFYDIPRVLIADTRSFQASAAILDYLTYLALIACLYRIDAKQDEFRSQATLWWISKVRGCSRWSAKKKTQVPVLKQQNTSKALF